MLKRFWVFLLCVPLSACLEYNIDANFDNEGRATTIVEMGIADEFLAEVAKRPRRSHTDPLGLIENCTKYRIPPQTKPSTLSRRDGKTFCITTYYVVEPIAATASGSVPQGVGQPLPSFQRSFEPIPNRRGYRGRLTFQPFSLDIPAGERGVRRRKALADSFINIRITAERIENTNGSLSEDRRTVTWRIPLTDVFLAGDRSKSVNLEADVIYDLR